VLILGVDPGQNGGLALVEDGVLVNGIRMPTLKHRQKKVIDAGEVMMFLRGRLGLIVIESVHAMPKQGVSSSFQFGRSFGAIEALMQLQGAPIVYVTPSVWKKALGLSSDKQASIDAAHLRFGDPARRLIRYKADDGIAEAALLAEWGWKTS